MTVHQMMNRQGLREDTRAFLDRSAFCYIDGQRLSAAGGETFDTINPSDGTVISRIARGGAADIDLAVAAARQAFHGKDWSGLGAIQRAGMLWKIAELIDTHAAELAELESADTGKPVRECLAIDVAGAALWFRYYSGAVARITGQTFPMTVPGEYHAFTLREPVGVVGAITPWNFPLVVAAWKLAPALACGCTAVVKPPEEASLTTLRLAELTGEAGVPAGVVNVVPGFGEEAGAPLAAHRDVDKITFTGSTEVGGKIVEASKTNFKRLTLELGGKSANVMFGDCDVATAAKVAARVGIFRNTGQICSAGSRILAHRSIYDQVVEEMAKHARAIRVGPGLMPETQMGPIISETQMNRVLALIGSGLEEQGVEAVAGGGRSQVHPDGYFVEPTVFAGVENRMRIAQEEIFGPVAVVIPFDDDAEALAIANDTIYGLAAGVWTNDVRRAHLMIQRLRAGTVWVNTYNLIDATTPWGGFGQSGIGREHGEAAIEEFTEIKTGVFALR
jgi:aldehyde dehydrogenase (NAD+)